MLVVKGKIDPRYVLYDMSLWEIEPLVDAISKSNRPAWERARMVAIVVGNSMGAKLTAKSIPFAWDNEEKTTTTGEQIASARKKLTELKRNK